MKDRPWVRNPIDAFILADLKKRSLSPNRPTDRRTLLRRVTFDLIGLPPTPKQVEEFVGDSDPNAYEVVVKRLLATPEYGERWGQHWLDVVRFAETNGYEHDLERPQAWRYRDWVVKALNEDMAYDRFLQLQIAGDELLPTDFDARVATGFLRAGPQHLTGGNQDEAVNRQEWLTEAVNGIGSGILALTIGCARCHDHKYDPISQADYYRLQAFFAASDNAEYQAITPEQQKAYDQAVEKHKARLKPMTDQIAAIEKPYREKLRAEKMTKLPAEYAKALEVPAAKRNAEQKRLAGFAGVQLNVMWDEVVAALNQPDREKRAGLRKRMHAIEIEAPEPLPSAPGVADQKNPIPKAVIHPRGDPHLDGPDVVPGFLAVMGSRSPAHLLSLPKHVQSTGRRLTLARWITDKRNPLTARVIVNRLWHYYFGRGIVATPNDFGKNGLRPTHPELLDWLAAELVEPTAQPGGPPWSLKRMHYLIVTSNSYRQASELDARNARSDPDNRYVWRMNRKRLDAESLRDSILNVSGELNPQIGGPSVKVPLEPEVYETIFTEAEPDNLWPVHPDPKQHVRRSLYLLRKRNVRLPMLAVFDQPDMMSSCGARAHSVHALQSLTLINSDFMTQQSRQLAKRLWVEIGDSEAKRIERLFALTLNRPPTRAELAATQQFLARQRDTLAERIRRGEPVPALGIPKRPDDAETLAWIDLCLATLNRNEFLYIR